MNKEGVSINERMSELPFVASTTSESLLGALIGARRSREKLREAARHQLGVSPLGSISFGRKGRAQIEASMLLPFTTIVGTTPVAAPRFSEDLAKHGVIEAFSRQKALAPQVFDYLRTWGNENPLENGSLAAYVNRALAQLTATNGDMRLFAETQRDLMQEFSRAESGFSRLPGQLVRIEDDEALVSVWNEETSRNELRSLDAAQVRDVGADIEGDALIVYETEYVPGIRVSTVVPGVKAHSGPARDLEEDLELASFESPLPTAAALAAEERAANATEPHSARTRVAPGRLHRTR